jgi:hypothetical protein
VLLWKYAGFAVILQILLCVSLKCKEDTHIIFVQTWCGMKYWWDLKFSWMRRLSLWFGFRMWCQMGQAFLQTYCIHLHGGEDGCRWFLQRGTDGERRSVSTRYSALLSRDSVLEVSYF